MKIYLLILLVVLVSACSSTTETQVISSTKIVELPTPTKTITPRPTVTPTFTPTVTPTSIPEDVKNQILHAYKIMIFIEVEVNLLQEFAEKVNSGELSGFDSLGSMIVVAAFVEAIDQIIEETTIPDLFNPFWENAIPIHESTKDLLAKWFNKEIDSSAVLSEVAPYIDQINLTMDGLDQELSLKYGIETDELKAVREESVSSMDELFTTATPTQ